MSIAQGATFQLERFEWRPPDRIQLVGSWVNVDDVELTAPVLVLRGGDQEVQLPALWNPVDGRPERGRWRATFLWSQDPSRITDAMLRVGEDLVLDLPSLGRGRPRFGRTVLRARPGAPAMMLQRTQERLELHTALVFAREDATAAREEAREARESARAAQQSLTRERARAKGESERMREALAAAEDLANRSVKQVAAVNELLKVELRDANAALDDARGGLQAQAHRLETVEGELDAALKQNAALREDVERLQAQAQRLETIEGERDGALRQNAELRTDAERLQAALAGSRSALEEAVAEERRAADLAGEELQSRHASEVAELRDMVQMRERAVAEAEQRAREAEQLAQDAEQRGHELAGLRDELEEARAAARAAQARSTTLMGRLTAIRQAMDLEAADGALENEEAGGDAPPRR